LLGARFRAFGPPIGIFAAWFAERNFHHRSSSEGNEITARIPALRLSRRFGLPPRRNPCFSAASSSLTFHAAGPGTRLRGLAHAQAGLQFSFLPQSAAGPNGSGFHENMDGASCAASTSHWRRRRAAVLSFLRRIAEKSRVNSSFAVAVLMIAIRGFSLSRIRGIHTACSSQTFSHQTEKPRSAFFRVGGTEKHRESENPLSAMFTQPLGSTSNICVAKNLAFRKVTRLRIAFLTGILVRFLPRDFCIRGP